jgi:hypothetical protein
VSFRIQGTIQSFSDPVRRDQIADKVVAYLRRHEPFASDLGSDDDLRPLVLGSIICGDQLGIRKLSGFNRFGYLWALTDGRIGYVPEVMNFIRYGGRDADDQVEILMQSSIDDLHHMANQQAD